MPETLHTSMPLLASGAVTTSCTIWVLCVGMLHASMQLLCLAALHASLGCLHATHLLLLSSVQLPFA